VPELLFAALVVVGLPARAWRRYQRRQAAASTGRYIVETLTLTSMLGVLLARRHVPWHAIGLPPASLSRFVVDAAVCVGIVLAIDGWSTWRAVRTLRRHGAAIPPTPALAVDTLRNRRSIGRFAAVAIVGAVWEELCFRASWFLLVPHTGLLLPLTIASGAVVFGLQHLRTGVAGFAYACGFAVMFSLLYLATADLIAVVIAHAVGNILAVVYWAPRIEHARGELTRQEPIFVG
jgi:membrane protease YdiL (CAAX protease family)